MKSKLHRTKDYYYYRGSRLTSIVMLTTSLVLGVFSMGYGQVSKMLQVWNTQEAYYTGDILDAFEVLKNYGYTKNQVLAVYLERRKLNIL